MPWPPVRCRRDNAPRSPPLKERNHRLLKPTHKQHPLQDLSQCTHLATSFPVLPKHAITCCTSSAKSLDVTSRSDPLPQSPGTGMDRPAPKVPDPVRTGGALPYTKGIGLAPRPMPNRPYIPTRDRLIAPLAAHPRPGQLCGALRLASHARVCSKPQGRPANPRQTPSYESRGVQCTSAERLEEGQRLASSASWRKIASASGLPSAIPIRANQRRIPSGSSQGGR